ncbi:MAG: hypothetical protein EA412_01950, partial [Chitinophagaceae bacterium]
GFLLPRLTTQQRDNDIATPIPEGLVIYNIDEGCVEVFDGTDWRSLCDTGAPPSSIQACGVMTEIVEVTNPTTGRIWMDRNLGATQQATSALDEDSYGCLYQWGRGTDGHEFRNSNTTTNLSASDTPGHGDFITVPSLVMPMDWRDPQNDNLWQGVNGINNPCPGGFRIPTEIEWVNEVASWNSNSLADAFDSELKISRAGARRVDNANIIVETARYWTSTTVGDQARYLTYFTSFNMSTIVRGYAVSVRCIKD